MAQSQQPPISLRHKASILRMSQLTEEVGLCRTSIENKVKAGTFPRPIKLGERAVGWLACDIDKWIEERARASKKAA